MEQEDRTIEAGGKTLSKGERRRKEIIAAAVEIFSRDGFTGASFASVAEAVHLTLPGLLYYFPSKVDLLLEVLMWRDEYSEIPIDSEPVHWRLMMEKLKRINRMNAEIPGVVGVFSILNAESLTENHPAADWFSNRFARVHDLMSRSFASGIESGEIAADMDPDQLASEVISVMDGLQIAWLRAPEKADLVGAFDAYADRFLRSIEQPRIGGHCPTGGKG